MNEQDSRDAEDYFRSLEELATQNQNNNGGSNERTR
jgi:hypothetical protein